jgi:hypothetical protein
MARLLFLMLQQFFDDLHVSRVRCSPIFPVNLTVKYLKKAIAYSFMPSSILFPLDILNPSRLLARYSEWIYFGLLMVFFISIAGITLKRYFDKPYIKPLVVTVGLMMTVGVFKMRERIANVFEGWGLLGTVVLFLIAITIPFGLLRGFGLSVRKAFYSSYILFYILSWVKFPEIYYSLADHNLGLVNLALLILCVVSVYRVLKFGRSLKTMAKDLSRSNPFRPEIEQETADEILEKQLVNHQGRKATSVELNTLEDIEKALNHIEKIVRSGQNRLSSSERQKIIHILREIAKSENVLRGAAREILGTFQKAEKVDTGHLHALKGRLSGVRGKEADMIKKEIAREEEKSAIEKAIIDFQSKLDQHLFAFNRPVAAAEKLLESTEEPQHALSYLAKARQVLKNINVLLREMKSLEKRFISLENEEIRLLRREQKMT